LDIRARLNLEVGKFKANAKAAGASFKIIASSAKISTDKIDGYLKSSNDKRIAQLKRTEAQEIESARRRSKILSKIEQEKYRNQGGIRPGTNVGRNLGLEQKQIAAMSRMSAKERAAYEKQLAKEFKALEKEKLAAGKARLKRQGELEKAWANNDKATLKAIAKAYKDAEKEKEAAARARTKREQELTKAFAGYEKNEKQRYTAWLKANTRSQLADIVARNKAAIKQMKQDAMQAKINYFNSEEFERKLASTRYALYDISRRAAMFGVAIGGAFALAVKSAVQFESAFTAVERTTQLTLNSNIPEVRNEAQALRDTLIELTTEIPVAFADIANIATIGAQMGIAARDVDEFTETVAKFSAITKIGAEDVALSFGRIAQLTNVPVQEFEKLSSAIAFTGVNSVATDREILKMAESIGAAATNAGFAADETIGFASALASLKVRPEEARGVLTRLFREFDLSVSRGGAGLDDLARIIGTTSYDAAELWKQDPSQFVQAMLRGAAASGELNKVITSLGITNTRELNVITRLANNMGVLEQALSDSSEQFELGTFSTEAYGLVTDDIAAKVTTLQNSVAALGASFGDTLLPILGPVLDALQNLVRTLTAAPAPIKAFMLIITGLVGGIALLSAGVLGGVAGLLALKLAFQNLQGEGIKAGLGVGTLRALIVSLIPAAGSATTVTGALAAQARAAGASFMAASLGAKAFQASLGFIGILSVVAGAVAVFAGSMAEAEQNAQKMTQANFDAAGGLEAFKKASEEGVESGARVYGEVTASVEKLTEAQIAEKEEALKAAVAKAELLKNTEDGASAYETAKERLEAFNDEIARGNGLLETSTIKFTENTKEVIANALAKIDVGEDEPLNIFAEIAEFDVEGLSKSARRSLEASGIDAADILNKSIEAAMSGEMTAVEYMEQQFANADFQIGMRNSKDLSEFAESMLVAASTTDGLITSAEKANAAAQVMGKVFGDTGQDMEEVEGDFVDLNDVLKETVSLLTSGDIAEGKVASALDTFAQGVKDTDGALTGLGESARNNLSNFASFMDSAVEASIQAGEGTDGALRRMIDGLDALSNAGIDTAEAFDLVRVFAVNALIQINPAIQGVKAELASAPDLAGMRAIVNAFYAAKIAAEGWSITLNYEWQRAIAAISTGTGAYGVNLKQVDNATKRTQTALEKLQETIGRLFSYQVKRMDLQESVNALGDSLEENGNTFSIWSKEGRSNVNSLLDVIDNMAVMSNGNLQVFANQLGAMREALVRAGAPASALKLIDDALKKTGKTAKVSKKEVENFYRELADSDDAENSIAKIAAAVSNVQSTLRASISAYFAQQNAIDDITLGWLDLADASDAARESIENAEEAIEDARRTIDEANASIQSLSAESNTLEYQLQIALKYGDTLRADEIRGELAEINAEMAKEQDTITDANKAIAKSQKEVTEAQGQLGIEPTTRQIIEQNRALQDMAAKYADAAAWMLATAGEGEDLNAIIESQVTDFYNNALQMGFSETQASDLAKVMRTELLASLEAIPEDITTDINAETSEALSKVTKFAKDANARLATIKDKNITVTTTYREVQVASGGGGGGVVRRAAGGLVTGPGSATSDSIPALLSNGEYVVKASAVSRYGVDFLNSINQMRASTASRVTSSSVAGSSQTVYLSPEDRQLLRQAIDRPVALYTDNATIAQSANEGNRILAQRGIR
jgi:TP901 family phage tail tape measure protein